jgi:putative nucleotide binding protein
MSDAGSDEAVVAVVLDYLPTGRPDDDRPQYQKDPIAYALGVEDFRLYELVVDEDAHVLVGDRLAVEPAEAREEVVDFDYVDVAGLSGAARSELEYAVNDIIDEGEQRFVDFYNDAQPITLRLHQLNLLPGIGKKLRNTILDERKRKPFESFEELEERVSGLHKPREVLVERIMEELQEEDLKYRIFARRPSQADE